MDAVVAQAGKMGIEQTMVNFVKRPGFGTRGRPTELFANSYEVTRFPTKTVIQYDVRFKHSHPSNALHCPNAFAHRSKLVMLRQNGSSSKRFGRLPLSREPWEARQFGDASSLTVSYTCILF